jgi:hexokinase
MLPAWVMGFPDGTESGGFLALDMGGTNLRVCEVVLLKDSRKYDMIQSKYRMVLPIYSNISLTESARPSKDWNWRTTFRLYSQLSR